MTWVDSLIGFFSPRAAYNRLAYRKAGALVQRKFDGAAKGRRTEGWHSTSASANSENAPALAILRDRSRDLVRNNPYAARGISLLEGNIVGKGILPHIPDEKLMRLWQTWAETPACDLEGRMSFYSMQALAMRSIVESGEVLIRKRVVEGGFPLKLQVLEADFIAKELDQQLTKESGNTVIQGIELDKSGRKVAYHLYETHPGASGLEGYGLRNIFKTNRVPADQIVHAFRAQRPGQLRGIPWLAPVMLRLRDLDDFEDAQLVRQKIAACFSVFVRDAIKTDSYLSAEEKIELGSKVEPGLIEMLPPGKDVTFASPPGVEGYKDYLSVNLHAIAIGLGVSYEALTGDLSQVNFSSARMGWLEFQRNIESARCHILAPQLNDPVYNWFLDAAVLAGEIKAKPTDKVRWTAPRRDMIDPTKEVESMKVAVRNGFLSWSDAIRELGNHPQDQAEKIAEDYKTFDKFGLTLECDPRFYDEGGDAQENLNANQEE